MISFNAVVFDFDLTLADSSAAFIDCHRFAALRAGLEPPTEAQIRASIGTPLTLVFPRFYDEAHASLAEEYIASYQARADEVMTGLTIILDGAPAAIRTLRDAGYALGIVSQKLRYRVEDVLRREGLLGYFGCVLGGDDIPAYKPDPSGLRMAVEKLDSDLATLYVGDTVIDAEAAHRAGLPFVAVLTGITPAEDFAPFNPIAVLPSVADLPALLASERRP